MNYILKEYRFTSSDGKNTIYSEIYTPKNMAPRGVVQLVHGMIDYTGRYLDLAEALTANGYVFAGHHQLGHGKSVMTADDYGYFAEKDGYKYVIEDVKLMNSYLRKTFPLLPIVILGHSMGSFISRMYVEEYPTTVQGIIIHGTGGPNPLVGVGRGLAKLIKLLKGSRHRSKLIDDLAFGSYNKRYPKDEGHNAWLTRDAETITDRDTNEFTSFKFTDAGYVDLFTMLKESNSKKWFNSYPKGLPTLIMSGDMDPVGNYGDGPRYVYKQLMLNGATNVKLKMYEGARHELFKETNRQEVFADILEWLGGIKG